MRRGALGHLSRQECMQRLARVRDELVSAASGGRFCDAAGREWSLLPVSIRMALLLLAGVGDGDLPELAAKRWQEFAPQERDALRAEVRMAKRAFAGLSALAARV